MQNLQFPHGPGNREPLTRPEFERIAGLSLREIPAALQAVGHALYRSGCPLLGRIMARVAAQILLDKPFRRVGGSGGRM